MVYTLSIIGFLGACYSFLTMKFKEGKVKNFLDWLKDLFNIHCRKTIISDYKYAIHSVCVILGIVFGWLMLISWFVETVIGSANPYFEAISKEMAIIFFLVFLGRQGAKEFQKETIAYFKFGFYIFIIALAILNVIQLSNGAFDYTNEEEFLLAQKGLVLPILLPIIIIFSAIKLVPYISFHGITKLYMRIIKNCYSEDDNKALGKFFVYFSMLVASITVLQWIVGLFLC